MIKLAIDIMGGDFAPIEIIKGCNLALKEFDDLELLLFGDEEVIKQNLSPELFSKVQIVNTPKKVDMGEKDPIGEIRRNRDTSLVCAFQAVKDKKVDGVVTAGPTQAVIPAAHLIIRRIKGMKRVALCPELPALGTKKRLLLDVGANIELRSEHLLQLAEYATIYARETKGIEKPLVGLINIGSEPGKGREVDKETFELLKNDPHINFFGNIEPKEMFKSDCDILLTDGYIGNVVMKSFEGAAITIGKYLKNEIKKSLSAKIGYLFMKKVFKKFKQELNPDEVGGATLFGVDGVVVKAHGASTAYAFSKAISAARHIVKADVVSKMKEIIVLSGDDNE